jgi:hypothetical protein
MCFFCRSERPCVLTVKASTIIKNGTKKMTQIFLSVALSLVFGWGCAHYAARRGRNPKFWFFAGALFGILALIVLFVLPTPQVKNSIRLSKKPDVPTPPLLATILPSHADRFWYYLDGEKKQLGPMSFSALNKAWNDGSVLEQTFVWNEEMENWQYFKDVVELQKQTGN